MAIRLQREILPQNRGYCRWFLWTAALVSWTLTGCIQEKASAYWQLSDHQQVHTLDSAIAAVAIVEDAQDAFFERINKLDMSLQLKQQLPDTVSREEVLAVYREALRREVSDFTGEEQQMLYDIMAEIAPLCQQLSPALLPPVLNLIKIKGHLYGPGVYFTREHSIIIPADQLSAGNREVLMRILLHEIFHVYSRYHPRQREKLYALIGFRALGADSLVESDSLKMRRLLNPDGVNCAYAIRLRTPWGRWVEAVPLLYAEELHYNDAKKSYGEYLKFNLFRTQQLDDGSYAVISTQSGLPPFSLLKETDLYQQIGDNTTYIIHPDEIMADNIALLALSKSGREQYHPSRLSERGRRLQRDIYRVLRADTRAKKSIN
ncbi:MAG: hypothetical protein JNK77_17790 [Saprospiraceae bacterium]|nr:hypothetical protein [Saprospiraceae bacterium]